MSRHQAAGRAGEAAVCEEGDALAQALPDQGGGNAEHLAHPGSTFWALVTDHYDVARDDAAGLDRLHGLLLGVEDAGGTRVLETGVACHLHDAPLGGEVALEDDEAAGGAQRVLQGDDHVLARRLLRVLDLLLDGAAGHGPAGAVQEAGLHHALAEKGGAPGPIHVHGDVAAPWLEVGDDGGAPAHAVEVVDVEGHARLAGEGEEVEHRVGRPTGGGDGGYRVLERLAGEDVGRLEAAVQEVHDQLAGLDASLVLAGVVGWRVGVAHRREAEEGERQGHGVGGVLAAARAGAGTGVVLHLLKVPIVHLAYGVGSYGLVDVLDGHVALVEAARRYRPAIDHEAGDVEPEEGHRAGRDGLVAADQAHDGVEHVAAPDELDGVGDHLAAYEGGLHPFGAHRDAVGDGDSVELHRGPASLADAFLDPLGEAPLVEVARHRLDPGVRHPDYRLLEVLVAEADGLEHSPGARPVAAFEDRPALVPGIGGLHRSAPIYAFDRRWTG